MSASFCCDVTSRRRPCDGGPTQSITAKCRKKMIQNLAKTFLQGNTKAHTHTHYTCNCKTVSLHAIEALGGEKRYSYYLLLTSALEGARWSA